MLKYTVKKILGMIPMLLIITFIIYWLLDLTPGDPTSYLMDPESLARLTNEQMAALRAQYGLDDPFVIRYFKWLFRILQGDFGYSTSSGVPVIQIMAQRLPATLELAVAALLISTVLGSILGVLGAIYKGSIGDNVLTVAGMIGVSIPQFFFGVCAILIFALNLGWLPVGGRIIVPTNAYALLTGKNTMQQNIQCAIFKGNDRAYFVDRREFNGPIQEQMEAAYQYVLEKINRGMKIDGIYRQDVYELPIDSVRELIANAVAHRSYLDPGNIQVALYDNRLEITSPGMLMNGVTIEKMKEGYSKIRNRAIANAFSYMKIIEKWGSGIPRIIRECQEYGLPEPELIDFDGDFRINMYRQPSLIQAGTIGTIIGIKVTSPEERVLTIMKQNARVTQKELQKELGNSLRTIKRMIAELQDKGYIVRRGNNRSGEWIVKG